MVLCVGFGRLCSAEPDVFRKRIIGYMAALKIWQKFVYVRAKVHICFASKCVAFRADFIAKKRGICLAFFTLPHVIKNTSHIF